MKTALCFLQAARRSEMAELERLARTASLVDATGDLVHGLQRERGLANRLLATHQRPVEPHTSEANPVPPVALIAQDTEDPALPPWAAQATHCMALEAQVRHAFDTTPAAQAAHGARLYARMAYALQGMDALPQLRALIRTHQLHHRQATEAYVKLIAGLLAVVFEAADSAADPAISRLLVALFNHMQGKEWAGQERAVGTAMWSEGRADTDTQQRLQHLIESQERCLRVFADFAPPAVLQLTARPTHARNQAELERLRRLALGASDRTPLDTTLSATWFDCCTARIDDLKVVEDHLTQELVALCQQRMTRARDELQRLQRRADEAPSAPSPSPLAFFASAAPLNAEPAQDTPAPAREVERSILDLVREQSHRLQTMEAELETVRASLNERKLIERAKGVLMAHRRLSEEDAHRFLRQTAMSQNRRLVDVADALLSMADVLPPAAG
jgi:hypothetical protein